MPSFLEILDGDGAAALEDGSNGPEAPPDILASVKAEGGRRRRRRHRRNLVVSGVAAVLLAVPALALLPDDGGDRDVLVAATPERDAEADRDADSPVTTIASGTPQTTVVATPTPTPTPTETSPEPTPTSVRPAPTVVPPPTEPALVCSNSLDPACGDFYWDPAPGANGALALDPEDVPVLAPGETWTIVVHWSDPDATLAFSDSTADDGALLAEACASETRRYGPWTPPAPSGGSGTLFFQYTAPMTVGSDTVAVYASTGTAAGCGEYDPYYSFANLSIPITVQEPAP